MPRFGASDEAALARNLERALHERNVAIAENTRLAEKVAQQAATIEKCEGREKRIDALAAENTRLRKMREAAERAATNYALIMTEKGSEAARLSEENTRLRRELDRLFAGDAPGETARRERDAAIAENTRLHSPAAHASCPVDCGVFRLAAALEAHKADRAPLAAENAKLRQAADALETHLGRAAAESRGGGSNDYEAAHNEGRVSAFEEAARALRTVFRAALAASVVGEVKP